MEIETLGEFMSLFIKASHQRFVFLLFIGIIYTTPHKAVTLF